MLKKIKISLEISENTESSMISRTVGCKFRSFVGRNVLLGKGPFSLSGGGGK